MKESQPKNIFSTLLRPWRIFMISFIGYITIIIGIILLPLPGPGTLVIWAGLGILALEFEWARQVSKKGQQWLERLLANLAVKFKLKKPQADKPDESDTTQ